MSESRVVLVTGASGGIGAAVARACAAAGMRVALAARREELLRQLAAELESAGGEAFACPTDVADPAQVKAMAASALERFGQIHVLVANAGIGYSEIMERITDEQILRTVEVNLLGVVRCVRAVLPAMIDRRRGHVITVSSVAAGIATPRACVYAATKAGIHRFAEGLRREVRRHGIHVTDILPGIIDTPMVAHQRGWPKAPPEVVARAILAAIRRPRRSIVVPWWYRLVLAANSAFPWLMDALIARQEGRRS